MIISFGKRFPGSKPEAPGSEIDLKASGRLRQYLVSCSESWITPLGQKTLNSFDKKDEKITIKRTIHSTIKRTITKLNEKNDGKQIR